MEEISVQFKHKSKPGKSIETICISSEVTENSLTTKKIERIIKGKWKKLQQQETETSKYTNTS